MVIKNLFFFTLAVLFISCNRDEVVVAESGQAPVIELDSEDGIYAVKIGRELVIAPTYRYADHALFAWTIEGKLISTDPTLKTRGMNRGRSLLRCGWTTKTVMPKKR